MKNRRHTHVPVPSAPWLGSGRWCPANLCVFLFLLCPYFCSGQTRQSLTGTWMGVHTEMDSNSTCVLPTYIRLTADSVYELGMVDGSARPLKSTWAIDGEQVRLDTIHFAPRLVRAQNGLLRIGGLWPMVFRQFKDTPIDSVSTYRQLSGRVWQSDNLTVYLYPDGQASLDNRVTQQRTVHFWRLATFERSVFLVVFGSPHNREGGYQPLWQVTQVLPSQLQAIGWNGCSVGPETFRMVRSIEPDERIRPAGWQPCVTCFMPLSQSARLNLTARQFEINQILARNYQPVPVKGQSGLLTISFVVNCAGESGLFSVKGFDDDYCPKTFDTLLTSQLLAICRNVLATTAFLYPGKDPVQPASDMAVSLTVRLKDGHITDILP
jgi:hypothetical protein